MIRKQVKTNQDVNKRRLDYIVHLAVLKNEVDKRVEYISNLEITNIQDIPRMSKFDSYLGIKDIQLLSKEQIHHGMRGSIPPHQYDGMPSSRVMSAIFMINNGVATMEKYGREPETPLSAIIYIDALIIMAGDLKNMGCRSVVTDVLIPRKNGANGKNKPILINIDEWMNYLRDHKSQIETEFTKQPLLQDGVQLAVEHGKP